MTLSSSYITQLTIGISNLFLMGKPIVLARVSRSVKDSPECAEGTGAWDRCFNCVTIHRPPVVEDPREVDGNGIILSLSRSTEIEAGFQLQSGC